MGRTESLTLLSRAAGEGSDPPRGRKQEGERVILKREEDLVLQLGNATIPRADNLRVDAVIGRPRDKMVDVAGISQPARQARFLQPGAQPRQVFVSHRPDHEAATGKVDVCGMACSNLS